MCSLLWGLHLLIHKIHLGLYLACIQCPIYCSYLGSQCFPLKKKMPSFRVSFSPFIPLTWISLGLELQARKQCPASGPVHFFSTYLACSSPNVCRTPSLPVFRSLLNCHCYREGFPNGPLKTAMHHHPTL